MYLSTKPRRIMQKSRKVWCLYTIDVGECEREREEASTKTANKG